MARAPAVTRRPLPRHPLDSLAFCYSRGSTSIFTASQPRACLTRHIRDDGAAVEAQT